MDDDPEVRELLRLWLANEGYAVELASGGRQGLEKQRQRPFDLIVMDLFMPEGDGLEFLTKVRPRDIGLPVIAVSGGAQYTELEGLDLARYLGASRTLAKPFQPSDLVAAARSLLSGKPPRGADAARRGP